MTLKDMAWSYFNKSGSVEAYLLYKQVIQGKEVNELVCEHTGSSYKGNKGWRQ